MRILITGNLGFIGPHVTKELIKLGHDVVGVDLKLYPNAICDQQFSLPQKQFLKDYRSLNDYELREIDAIIHLAALSNDPLGRLRKHLTLDLNGYGVIDFAKRAKKNHVKKFVFASSCSVYGNGGDVPRIESDETNPLTEYAQSKLIAEAGLLELSNDSFETFSLRFATAYGASPVFRTDLVVNNLISSLHIQNRAYVKSDGTPWRPLINCVDMANILIQFAVTENLPSDKKIINAGFNEDNYQIFDIVSLLKNVFKDCQITIEGKGSPDPRSYQVDFSLLKCILPNFVKSFSLQQGIIQLKQFLQRINFNEFDFNNDRFSRVTELVNNKKYLNL